MFLGSTAARDTPAPPLATLPPSVLASPIGDRTLAEAADEALRFSVEWESTTARLEPISTAARSMAHDPASATHLNRIASAISMTASDGPNRVGRLTLAPTRDAWTAARLLPRVEFALASAASADSGVVAATRVLAHAASLATQHADAEFVPVADEIVVGPAATRTLLGLAADGEVAAASPTRAIHVLRHELAHAARPISNSALAERSNHVYEEGRAELLTRSEPRMAEFATRLGLELQPAELASSGTYPFERGVVGMLLTAMGVAPGSSAATTLLSTTPGERLVEVFAESVAARTGADPRQIARDIRAASNSHKQLGAVLTGLGLPA